MHKLKVEKLEKVIKKTKIINDISLEVTSGEVVGLLGPNGAGKTTTFYMICGLIEATSGKIYLDNQDISDIPLHKRAKLGIGYLPQESSIFKDLSVEENIMLACEIIYDDKDEVLKKTDELLELLNIEPIRRRKAQNLSGGERRRCEIARSLALKPKFLLLDEPFAGVDPIAVADIQDIIKELAKLKIGILITDHNVRETLSICDKAYVIKDGSLLAQGSAEEIFDNKLVKTYYLGDNFKL
ncbi:MAG: LPS export ABC transporter ATP-binding protein [Epsilonproteobacteria bacterium]|nr:LPS export ABC transporter ATP-binding protein [Campylobacterota bacterium]